MSKILSKGTTKQVKVRLAFSHLLKFIYSEKATKFCEISTLFLSECTVDKGKVEILQNFVVFLEYTNFITDLKKFSSLTLSDDSLN